ncbi:phosphate ABC transporter substrate-binding protein PstS [soil metagenome]
MFNLKRRGAMVASIVAVLGVAVPASAGASTITLSGSTSVAPLAAKLASKYVKGHKVKFKLLQGGSDVGISDVSHGRVTLGMSSRDPKPGDPGGLVFNKVARDAICVVTNKSNNVQTLNQNQIQAIFGGDVRDWSDVPGSNRSDTIDVYVRTAASGTQDAFQKLFMGAKQIFSGAKQKSSNGLVQNAVKSNPGSGIGYVSLPFAKGTNVIAYNGVPCTLRNAKSGQYTGVRNFFMVSRGAPTGAAKKWIKWIQTNKDARKIINSEWVPID